MTTDDGAENNTFTFGTKFKKKKKIVFLISDF